MEICVCVHLCVFACVLYVCLDMCVVCVCAMCVWTGMYPVYLHILSYVHICKGILSHMSV